MSIIIDGVEVLDSNAKFKNLSTMSIGDEYIKCNAQGELEPLMEFDVFRIDEADKIGVNGKYTIYKLSNGQHVEENQLVLLTNEEGEVLKVRAFELIHYVNQDKWKLLTMKANDRKLSYIQPSIESIYEYEGKVSVISPDKDSYILCKHNDDVYVRVLDNEAGIMEPCDVKSHSVFPIIKYGNDKDVITMTIHDILCKEYKSSYEPRTVFGIRVKAILDLFFSDISGVVLESNKIKNGSYTVKYLLSSLLSICDNIYNKVSNYENLYLSPSYIVSIVKTALSEFNNTFMLPKDLPEEWLAFVSTEEKILPVKMYDMESDELHTEAKIFGGKPDGVVNFEDTPHQFAVAAFKAGQERNWVAEQINVNEDVKIYPTLSPEKKRQLLLGTAQPTTNDSIQTAQISRLIQYVSSPVVVCALARQQYEEALHSQSYSRLIRDVVGENYIFYMHREYLNGEKNEHFSPELYEKNDAVRRMYARLYQTDHPTLKDLLLILVANQILEEMVFPGAFAFNYAFDERLKGFISMYEEINKDRA